MLVIRGPSELAGLGIMLGDQPQVFADALTRVLLQPAGDLAVELGPIFEQDRLVGHVAQQGVFEDVLIDPGERRTLAPENQLAVANRFERVL